MNLSNPNELKSLINKYGFSFSKNLGQNFLTDQNVLEQIRDAAKIDKSSGVLEIGAGAGVLTRKLAENAGRVVAVELDKRLMPLLHETLSEFENVKIINEDILKLDLPRMFSEEFSGMPVSVVANLPYYITTPIVIKLLENSTLLKSITVMVQKEVAARMCASEGSKDYGALSVAVRYRSMPQIICTASPQCFTPPPKVASSVVSLEILSSPSANVKDEKLFFDTVKAAFGQRRKTLVNALSGNPYFTLSKSDAASIIESLGLRPDIRGEKLSVSEFAALADRIYELR